MKEAFQEYFITKDSELEEFKPNLPDEENTE